MGLQCSVSNIAGVLHLEGCEDATGTSWLFCILVDGGFARQCTHTVLRLLSSILKQRRDFGSAVHQGFYNDIVDIASHNINEHGVGDA